jgi:FKBP-type peptidyl-prolyl cis-trans isomerase
MTRCAVLLLAAGALGCAQIGLQPRPVEVEHRKVATTSGLDYEELALGSGMAAAPGSSVTFDYTVWLADGTRVDSTLDRGVPITVTLGSAPLRAFDEGLAGMQPEGRRRLIVPPELAYGAEGVPDLVPPDATLVFEVHVLEVSR